MTSTSMAMFGLSRLEEDIYRHLLRNPGRQVDKLAAEFGVPGGTLWRHLLRLSERGFLELDEDSGVVPADPAVVVRELVELRVRELHESLQGVAHSGHLVASLQAEQSALPEPVRRIERLAGVETVRQRIDDLTFLARDEILAIEPHTGFRLEDVDHVRSLGRHCLLRGVRIRGVVLRDALRHPSAVEILRELRNEGAAIRVVDSASERVLVYDRSTALTPADPEDLSRGALIVREAGLVAHTVALFERVWDQAQPLDSALEEDDPSDAARINDIERRALQLMCQGHKDEVAARELDISVRTYRRYIADLLRLLGAANRPQAALMARDRGWV